MNYYGKAGTLICTVLFITTGSLFAQNPIVPGKGLCDPQVRIYNNKVWLYATHDASVESKNFVMYDWWVWSSTDLVNWNYESTLKPEDTYFGKPDKDCWATDAMSKNGKYYFYFSRGFTDIGVVMSDSPNGPWHDPLKKPLIPASLTPVEERDPSIIMDDDGSAYIVFGVWDFYIAKLNEDMISLAEEPKIIFLDKKDGPYGRGKTDDKSFIHKYNGKYYLSWGCYYAMSDNVYGPYTYKGSIYTKDRLEPEFWKSYKAYDRDRHGSFFELYNQWYFICNDNSIPGSTPYFRNSVISYVHYKDNGEIEPVYLTRLGVGRYDASKGAIEAENYFKASGVKKRECPESGYEIRDIRNGSSLTYPKVMNLKTNSSLSFRVASGNSAGGIIEIHENNANGKLLGTCKISSTSGWTVYKTFTCKLKNDSGQKDICLVFNGNGDELLRFNWFGFS
jgi:arabinoxylan arabinofuranohydrolase